MESQIKLLDFGNGEISTKNPPTLPFFSSQSLYQELESSGYVDSHKARVLKLLWDMQAHRSDEIVRAGGKQYNARVKELRREGWNIVAVRNGKQFDFILLSQEQRWKI